MSSVEYDWSVPTEFNKFYSSSLPYLIYFGLFLYKQNWPVCNAFLNLFSNLLLSLAFFQNCDYLLINMQNHGKNYERAESQEAKKKNYI